MTFKLAFVCPFTTVIQLSVRQHATTTTTSSPSSSSLSSSSNLNSCSLQSPEVLNWITYSAFSGHVISIHTFPAISCRDDDLRTVTIAASTAAAVVVVVDDDDDDDDYFQLEEFVFKQRKAIYYGEQRELHPTDPRGST